MSRVFVGEIGGSTSVASPKDWVFKATLRINNAVTLETKTFFWNIEMFWLLISTFGVFCVGLHFVRGTRWRSWLRHFAISYKPESRGFDSQWNDWNFSLTYFFRQHYVPGVDSASNRNDYQEYFLGGKGGRCVGLTTLPPSCVPIVFKSGSLSLLEPSGLVQACNGIALTPSPALPHPGYRVISVQTLSGISASWIDRI